MTPFTYKVFFTTEFTNSSIDSFRSVTNTLGKPVYAPVTYDFLESNGSVLKNNFTVTNYEQFWQLTGEGANDTTLIGEEWFGRTRIADSVSYSETYSYSIWGAVDESSSTQSSTGTSTSGTFPPRTSIQPYTYTTEKTTTQTASASFTAPTFSETTTQFYAYTTASTRQDSSATTSEATSLIITSQCQTLTSFISQFNDFNFPFPIGDIFSTTFFSTYTTSLTESTSYWNTQKLDASIIFIANGWCCADITSTGFSLFTQLFSTFSDNTTIEPSYFGTTVSTCERLKVNSFSSAPDTRVFSFTNTYGDRDEGRAETIESSWKTVTFIGKNQFSLPETTTTQLLTIGAKKTTFSVDVVARVESMSAFATQSKTVFLSKFSSKKNFSFFSDGLSTFQSSVFTLSGTTVVTFDAPFVFTASEPQRDTTFGPGAGGNIAGLTLAINITDTFTTYTGSRIAFELIKNNTSAEIKTLPGLLRREYTGLTRTETSYSGNSFAYAGLSPQITFLVQPMQRAAYPFSNIVWPTESRSGAIQKWWTSGTTSYTHSFSQNSVSEYESFTSPSATITASRSAAILLQRELPTICALWGNISQNGVPTHAVRYGIKEGIYFVENTDGTSYSTVTEANTFSGNGNALRIVPHAAFSASVNHEFNATPFTFSALSRYQAAEPLL
jgi:hypothetical protein